MKSLYKNILVLASGSLVSKLIGLICIPLITRIYTPSDMGILSAFVSIVNVIVAFAALRFTVVLPLPKYNNIALNASVVCMFSIVSVNSVLAIILYYWSVDVLNILDLNELVIFWWLIPLSSIALGFYEVLNIWLIRSKKFNLISVSNIFQSIIGNLSKIILGLFIPNAFGLIVGQICLQSGSFVFLLKEYLKSYQTSRISCKRIRFTFFRYISVPKYRLPSQIFLSLSMNIPILFYSANFGKEVAGGIALATTVLSLPIGVISQSIGQAFYGEIAKIGPSQPGLIKQISKKLLVKLLMLSVIPFTILYFWGETIFVIVFGEHWESAGTYASLMSIYVISNLISSPLINVLNVFECNYFYLIINISRFLVVCSIFTSALYFNIDVEKTIFLYSLALTIHYAIVSRMIFLVIKKKELKLDYNGV